MEIHFAPEQEVRFRAAVREGLGGLARAFTTPKSGCPALLAFFARDSLLPVKQFFLWREGRKGRV